MDSKSHFQKKHENLRRVLRHLETIVKAEQKKEFVVRIPSVPVSSTISSISPAAGSVENRGKSFVKTISEAVAQVNNMQLESATSGKQLGVGNAQSLHKVVLEAEEASLSMQMVVSLRNKALDAYQEVMRMQV